MYQKTKIVHALSLGCILIAIVGLSGCTTNQTTTKDTNTDVSSLLGTWVGAVQMQMAGGWGNTSVSQITFTSNTAQLTLSGIQESMVMNCTYTTKGNSLVLQRIFDDRGGLPAGQPFNGTLPSNRTHPPGNGTWPQNETFPGNQTLPLNGTHLPGNWTEPQNWSSPPMNQRPAESISFTYRLNEDGTILYLNDSRFTRIS